MAPQGRLARFAPAKIDAARQQPAATRWGGFLFIRASL
jgi:hypothetical protein